LTRAVFERAVQGDWFVTSISDVIDRDCGLAC